MQNRNNKTCDASKELTRAVAAYAKRFKLDARTIRNDPAMLGRAIRMYDDNKYALNY